MSCSIPAADKVTGQLKPEEFIYQSSGSWRATSGHCRQVCVWQGPAFWFVGQISRLSGKSLAPLTHGVLIKVAGAPLLAAILPLHGALPPVSHLCGSWTGESLPHQKPSPLSPLGDNSQQPQGSLPVGCSEPQFPPLRNESQKRPTGHHKSRVGRVTHGAMEGELACHTCGPLWPRGPGQSQLGRAASVSLFIRHV